MNATLRVPAGCVAQSWRDPKRQARLAAFLRSAIVDIVAMDDEAARRVGLLLRTRKRADVVDAHVALCALQFGHAVMTSDPEDIAALAPNVVVHRI